LWAAAPGTMLGIQPLPQRSLPPMASTTLFSPAEPLQVACIESQPFGQNTYVAFRRGAEACLVVDPGFEPAAIVAWIDARRLQPEAILLTHGHSDHIAGNAALRSLWPSLPIMIGRHDATKLTSPAENLSAAFGASLVSPPADRLLDDGDRIDVAPGSIALLYDDPDGPPHLITGDCLFPGGVGKTHSADEFDSLYADVTTKLFDRLPDETWVYPGHGWDTTIGAERPNLQEWRARGW